MKSLYIPESLYEDKHCPENLSQISIAAQGVIFRLLGFSNASYEAVYPSIQTLMRVCNVKSETSMRKYLREIESLGCLAIKKSYRETARGKLICNNIYHFVFKKWIDLDRNLGGAGTASDIPAMVERAARNELRKVNQRVDKIEFSMATLPDKLRELISDCVHVGEFHGTQHFETQAPVSKTFIESEFKKAGYKIHLVKKAS